MAQKLKTLNKHIDHVDDLPEKRAKLLFVLEVLNKILRLRKEPRLDKPSQIFHLLDWYLDTLLTKLRIDFHTLAIDKETGTLITGLDHRRHIIHNELELDLALNGVLVHLKLILPQINQVMVLLVLELPVSWVEQGAGAHVGLN